MPREKLLTHLRRDFITGIAVLLPLGVTLWVVNFLIKSIGNPASALIFRYIDIPLRNEFLLNTISTAVVLALITFLGIFSRYFLGRMTIRVTEAVLDRLPFINNVYRTVKQIVTTISEQKKAVFQSSVLIEYPRTGVWGLGFLTNTARGEIQERTEANLVAVFIPTTPNPTSGFLLFVPDNQVFPLDMSIADAMKVIISGGAVVPPWAPGPGQPSALLIDNPRSPVALDGQLPPGPTAAS